MEPEELDENHPFEVEASGFVPEPVGGSEPSVILELRTKGRYFVWKGKLPDIDVKLSMGVLDMKAIRITSKGKAAGTRLGE
jgi:hypothetical protein